MAAGETPIGANLEGESTETRRRICRASLGILRDFPAREVRITDKLAPMGETPALLSVRSPPSGLDNACRNIPPRAPPCFASHPQARLHRPHRRPHPDA